MASFFVYGYAGHLWSFSNYRALEEWLHPVLCLQGCFLFTEASGQGTGHSDCASWGWLVGYLWPEGFPVTCQRGPAHRSLCKPEPMTCTRQSPASSPPPTFCSICSQSATTQVLYTWDFLRGQILHVPITHTHTHTHTHTQKMLTMWGHTHITYLDCDDHFTMNTSIKTSRYTL